MREFTFIYYVGAALHQTTVTGDMAARFEAGLGSRMLGKIVGEAR